MMQRRLGWLLRSFLIGLLGAGWVACKLDDPPDLDTGVRTRSSAALISFDTCDALLAQLRSNLKEEMRIRLLQLLAQDQYRGGGVMVADEGAEATTSAGADSWSSNSAGPQEGTDFSGTNNQEAGVDEADFVKATGAYIYVLNGNRLEILGTPNVGELEKVATLSFEGYPTQMLKGEDTVVVFSHINVHGLPADHPLRELMGIEDSKHNWWWRTSNVSKLTVVDLTDPTTPTVKREIYLEGGYQTARKVDTSVRMVAFTWMDIPGLQQWPELDDSYYELSYNDSAREEMFQQTVIDTIWQNNRVIDQASLADFVPQIYVREGTDGVIQKHPFTSGGCGNFAVAEDGMSHGVTSIISLNLLGDAVTFDSDHVLSNWSQAYASVDTLVLAEPSQDWWWYWRNDDFDEATNIHRFDISGAGKSTYTGSGRVDGTILDQFSLSAYEGNIRVASTTGQWNRWWMEDPPEPENHVFVLGGETELQQIGHLGGIAVGERIWSSRFMGDRAYLVTFRNMDPLWTIDLSDPTNPTIKGELEVPGVSTYIHPLGDHHLLTIGYGGDEGGLDWGTQISLFDVTNFSQPALADSESLSPPSGNGWNSSGSEATHEHKAFQYWDKMKLLGIPLSTWRWTSSNNDNGYYEHYEYQSGLELISVDTETGLGRYGNIDHSEFYNGSAERFWNYIDVRRSIFFGDLDTGYIYAISDRGVTAHKASDLTLSASVTLPGNSYDPYWYW